MGATRLWWAGRLFLLCRLTNTFVSFIIQAETLVVVLWYHKTPQMSTPKEKFYGGKIWNSVIEYGR